MIILIFMLIFATITMVGYQVVPVIFEKSAIVQEKRQQNFARNMEQLMPKSEAKKMSRMFVFAPLALAGTFYFIFPEEMRLFAIVLGVVTGLLLPGIYIPSLTRKNKDRFDGQLVDALMIMSSSFRGGLSLIQALEAVVDEMPDPINKEFGIVLGENKMGVALDEAMYHLYNRMPSAALQQMITAILLARETGGNLPVIFNRIVGNIRERRKIQQNLDTLTLQGKIQGVVMSLLPIVFGFIVYTANRQIFEHMFRSEIGRMMLIYAAVSEIIGAILVWKISTFKDF